MRISNAVMKLLENNGVEYIYQIPAGTLSGFLNALADSKIKSIVTKSEAGASFCATRYAELSGKLGVCMVGSGVGIGNAMNGIIDAYRNKVPVLVITSIVNRKYWGKNAFQELDNSLVLKPVTKYSKTIFKEDEVIDEFRKAISIALTPPYGPVSLSVPVDVQMATYMGDTEALSKCIPEKPEYDKDALSKAIRVLNESKKGLIFVGRGSRGLGKKIKELSNKLDWGIISTPNGKGVIDWDFEKYLGNYGFISADGAVEYVENEKLDYILVLGSGLGQSATRDYNHILFKDRKVIRIDWDKNELNKSYVPDIPVYYDLNEALDIINKEVFQKNNNFKKIEMNKPYEKNHTGISLRLLLEKISDVLPKNTCYVQDIGDTFHFAFKYLPIKEGSEFQSSLNFGSMGCAIAGAVGSYLSNPERPYVVLVGDGSFYMNGMEILTARQYNAPIIYFVINNSQYKIVKNGLDFMFGDKFGNTYNFKEVNISDMTKAMGVESVQIRNIEDIDNIKHLFYNRKSPLVVEVISDGTEILLDVDRFKKVVKQQ